MEIDLPRKVTRGLLTLAVTLVIAGGVMGYLLFSLLRAAGHEPPGDRQNAMTRLAWVCLVMVLVDFIMLVAVAWRMVKLWLRPQSHGPTPYIDAWSLAGQRMGTDENRPIDILDEDEEHDVDPKKDDDKGDGEDDEKGDDEKGKWPRK